MKNQTRWIVIFITVLILSSLACQALFGDDETQSQAEETINDQSVVDELPSGNTVDDEEEAPTSEEPEETKQQADEVEEPHSGRQPAEWRYPLRDRHVDEFDVSLAGFQSIERKDSL